MEKRGKLLGADGGEFQRVTSVRAAQMVRARCSIKVRACSACAGDYEDPDRAAGEEFEEMLAGDEDCDSDTGDDDRE